VSGGPVGAVCRAIDTVIAIDATDASQAARRIFIARSLL